MARRIVMALGICLVCPPSFPKWLDVLCGQTGRSEEHAFFSVDPESVLQAVIGFNRAPLIMDGPHWPAVYESDSPGKFLARLLGPYHDMLLAISQCV